MGVKEMKNLKLSIELASTVLGKEVTKCSLINKSRNSINITYFEDREDFNPICREWNIYEFAFKCKEWARDKYNITISSALYSDYAKSWNVDKDKSYTAKTEVEVIIEACEWILEQNK